MKFYKYWARGKAEMKDEEREFSWEIVTLGWSDMSQEEAARKAAEAARQAAAAGRPSGQHAYGYPDRPLREEVVEQIPRDGDAAAVITRNSYGSLILNTARVMFIDIDREEKPSGPGFWARLFGKPKPAGPPPEDPTVVEIRQITASIPGLGLRLYRTAAGYRGLVTSRTYDPESGEAIRILEQFRSDPLYVRLCKTQRCFRARLTPKHWRCGVSRPPCRYPFDTREQETQYRDWEKTYQQEAAAFDTCRLIGPCGTTGTEPAVAEIVALHDRHACRGHEKLA